MNPRCRASGDLRRCGAEDFERERTFCAVCVTRLQRSWTSIDQHFQRVCTVYESRLRQRRGSIEHWQAWARLGTRPGRYGCFPQKSGARVL